jgi:hypothetical protein
MGYVFNMNIFTLCYITTMYNTRHDNFLFSLEYKIN